METMIHTASKSYQLIVEKGAIDKLWPFIQKMKPIPTKIMIITDDQVSKLHLNNVLASLGKEVIVHIVPHGEKEKNMKNYEKCLTTAIENGLDRHSLILALGGGMIGDLAGFVAASFMRGIRFIQIPTTLLAHDSAVGGKVAINHPLGKNMIGAFHQPDGVIYDLNLLQTLSDEEWRSGFAELLKHGYIEGEEFVKWIEATLPTMKEVKGDRLEEGLISGILVKAKIVKEDETEQGIRAYLNFGHTLGHALENLMGYGGISHGDAVAIGMRFAFLVSEWYYKKSFNRIVIRERMDKYGYPRMVNLPIDLLIQSMKKDKKSMNNHVRMVLISQYGDMHIEEVSDSFLKECLYQFIQEEMAN